MMKKILFASLFLTILPVFSPASAGTDPKTAKILKGIDSVYYNLRRQGLQRLHCEFRSDIMSTFCSKVATKYDPKSPILKALNDFKVSLDWDPATGWEVESPALPGMGDDRFDPGLADMAKAMRLLAGRIVNLWSGFMVEEVFSDEDLKKFDASIDDGGNDLLIGLSAEEEFHHFVLGPGFKIRSVRGERSDGSSFYMDPEFDRSPRGFVLTGWKDQVGEDRSVKITYGDVKGFLLPVKMGVAMKDEKTGKILTTLCQFSNYKVEGKALDN